MVWSLANTVIAKSDDMKISVSFKNAIVDIICLLYILLFVYAAVSKLFDYEGFRHQLSMSPILSSHATWLTGLVPSLEISFSILLAIPKTRIYGVFCSFNLMIMFTVYIYLIMNYASYVPCSCGGILEDMGWMEHFYFNIVFIVLALTTLFVDNSGFRGRYFFFISTLSISAILSGGVVIKLFLISEQIVHYENRFQRRFPHPSVTEVAKADLIYNSYYIAGIENGRIYLGNSTAPLHLLTCDLDLMRIQTKLIKIDTLGINFRSTQLRVVSGKFYLFDGTTPYIFEGSTHDWIGIRDNSKAKRFTLAEPIAENLAVRTFSHDKGDNILGIQPLHSRGVPKYSPMLLEKQVDGIFDTDGILLTSGQRAAYLYHYRNEFIVFDSSLELILKGKTIDTMSRAKIQVTRKNGTGPMQFEKIPLMVNKRATLYKNLLFVNSQLPGKEDSDKLWKQASIIDVYDIRDGSYRFSFPLYDIDGKKMDNFKVYGNYIYLINDKWIVRYDLQEKLLGD